MADPLKLIPIRTETIDSIRARMNADANAGLTPDDDDYLDLAPGGFWWDLTQADALEMERLWDFASHEVPAAVFVLYSYGEYLDDHGAALSVPRKDQVAASGVVRFTGEDGGVIPIGTQVSAVTTDIEADELTYTVTAGGTIPVGVGFIDLPVLAAEPGAAYNVAAGSIALLDTPIDEVTEVTNVDAISGGADVEEDEPYRERLLLELRGVGGGGTASQLQRYALAVPGIGFADIQPLAAGNGTARIMVRDLNGNPVSSAKLAEVQAAIDPPAVQTLTNSGAGVTLPLGGGSYPVDSTASFRTATALDPARFFTRGQVVTYTGKTATSFTGCTGGIGTIPDNEPVYQAGVGGGLAPIGMDVVIGTPVPLTITITMVIVHEDGYSLDGTGGSIATRADIERAIRDYIDHLAVGEDVILNAAEARAFRVRGVFDVSGTLINGVAANLAVSAEQAPQSAVPVLT